MINKLMMTAAAMMLAVPAMAQERPVTYFSGALVENPTYYAHGCDAFQYMDISQRQADQLLASGNCSVEASADGGPAQDRANVQAALAAAAAASAEEEDPVDPGDTAEVADPVSPAITRLHRMKRWLASRT